MSEVIGLLVDPGLPEARVRGLLPELRETAKEQAQVWTQNVDLGTAGDWIDSVDDSDPLPAGNTEAATVSAPVRIDLRVGTLPMDSAGNVRLAHSASGIMNDRGWDRMVYVTDLPLTTRRPVISQSVENGRATMLCLPAFGLLRARDALRQELTRLVKGLPAGAGVPETQVADIEGGDSSAQTTRVLEGRGRVLRLWLGMIRCNRPDKLIRVLSGCLATGVATGAFSIFYGSVWAMSSLIAVWRLSLITFVAIAALTFWLIFHNGLWNKWRGKDMDSLTRWRSRIDNLATVGTVGLAAAGIYVLIFLTLLLFAATVVPIPYFAQQISSKVSFLDYLTLAWFTASLGTMAGALGSGFDSDDAIREATYNRREHRRREIAGLFDDTGATG
ncbi:hypothetical protein [Corynebacterium auriscanis]|uniref:hypothetical protein n=1 Tax=Corynebacterium auriscanis TaxID=99807 RepID=UPI0024AD59CF|nr:hypothetical protein [Corynebacterium auriscanis]